MKVLLILLITASAWAQHSSQPEKESSTDLRTGITVFSIDHLGDEKKIWLERTANLDYFLHMQIEDEDEKIQKITTKDAKKMDMDFASKFLKCQYEHPPSEEGCKVTLRLTMKGEPLEVCKKDDKKTQEIEPFYQELQKRF